MVEDKYPPRIMHIERKAGELTGPARIGRVAFPRTGATIYYREKSFQKISGFKSNYKDVAGDDYWISGPKRNGQDSLNATNIPVLIDEDVREEYWLRIRKRPDLVGQKHT